MRFWMNIPRCCQSLGLIWTFVFSVVGASANWPLAEVPPRSIKGECHQYDYQRNTGWKSNIMTLFPQYHMDAELLKRQRDGLSVVMPDLFTDDQTGDQMAFLPKTQTKCTHVVLRAHYDGIGSQVHRKIVAMAYARANGYIYVHEPFVRIAHLKDESYVQIAEQLFDLGRNEQTWADVPKGTTVCGLYQCHHSGHHDFLSALQSQVQLYYWSSLVPKPPPLHASCKRAPCLTVAVHIRRGDAMTARTGVYRLTSNFFFAGILSTIKQTLPKQLASMLAVSIFSEGTRDDFADILKDHPTVDLRLDDDGSPFDTFHHLVTSDILVTSRSEFSWLAGYYSTGLVVFHGGVLAPDGEPQPAWVNLGANLGVTLGERETQQATAILKANLSDPHTHIFLRNRLEQRGVELGPSDDGAAPMTPTARRFGRSRRSKPL